MPRPKVEDGYLNIPVSILRKNLLLAEIFLLALIDYWNSQGIRKSYKDYCSYTGYSPSYIDKLVVSLREKGYLYRKTKRDDDIIWGINWQEEVEDFADCGKVYGNSRLQKKKQYAACAKPVEKSSETTVK